jgi:1-acyl-sn-glycerol-3-phosphate acyltransferase
MMRLFRLAQTVGFVAYVVATLIPIPAIMLLCAVVSSPLRLIGLHPVDFFQHFVGICTSILCIRHSFVPGHASVAQRGTIILANHRSWCDFAVDNHITHASCISRMSVQYAMLLAGALSICEQRVIRFHRGQTSKEDLYARVSTHMRRPPSPRSNCVLLYPEGTRRRHVRLSSVDECKATLKPGLLWMIYQKGQYPVQVVISSNKERALDERAWTIRLGVAIRTYAGTVLHPKDFASFDEFMDAIATQWLEAWTATHSADEDVSNATGCKVGHNSIDASALY